MEVSAHVSETLASVTLRFNDAGDIIEVSTPDRPRLVEGRSVPTPWGGAFSEYRALNGLRIPVRGVVWWDLPQSRFEYWRAEITSVAWE